jgi:hypothetical protein
VVWLCCFLPVCLLSGSAFDGQQWRMFVSGLAVVFGWKGGGGCTAVVKE